MRAEAQGWGQALQSADEREGMKEHTQAPSYEPPRVQVLGPVHVLTQSGSSSKAVWRR